MKIAITGTTGGLGTITVKRLVNDYELILINRNMDKANLQKEELLKINPNASITLLKCDMSDINSVKDLTDKLIKLEIDYLIINAGILKVKKEMTNFGYNNIFSVNFLAPYYIINRLKENNLPKVKNIVVSSVAYKMSKFDPIDIDQNNYKSINKTYGNSKRFLMTSLMELFKGKEDKLVIVHPGVTLTNMTKNYYKAIKWFIVIFMTIFFQGKKKASRSLYKAINTTTPYFYWLGPHIFGIYGKPKPKKVKKIPLEERALIDKKARELYLDMTK